MKALGTLGNGRTKSGLPPSTPYSAELFYAPHSSIYRLPHDANPDPCVRFASRLGSSGWRGRSLNGKLQFWGLWRFSRNGTVILQLCLVRGRQQFVTCALLAFFCVLWHGFAACSALSSNPHFHQLGGLPQFAASGLPERLG